MLNICMMMVRHHSTTAVSAVFAEVVRLLREWGVAVDVMFPHEMMMNVCDVKIDHDLYILKLKSELALGIAGTLFAAGAYILNPYPVTRMMRNKVIAMKVLKDAGVPVPDSYVAHNPIMLAPLLEDGPLVVKPYMGSMGHGVHVVWEADALDDISTHGELVFAQRYQKPEGRDHKIYVIGGQVFGVKRIWPARTYEEKMGEAFSITPDVREIALQCGRAFGVELYGLDIIWSNGKPYVVDISSFPGFKGVPNAALRIADYIYAIGQRVLNQEPMLPESKYAALDFFGNRAAANRVADNVLQEGVSKL
jgi:ribosomal protein S6--L-glutamate ligase